jgi:hypothetical protein
MFLKSVRRFEESRIVVDSAGERMRSLGKDRYKQWQRSADELLGGCSSTQTPMAVSPPAFFHTHGRARQNCAVRSWLFSARRMGDATSHYGART